MHRLRPRTLTLVVALAVPGCSEADRERTEAGLERVERRQQLRTRFASIQNQIRRVQAMALDSPGVKAAQEAFYGELRRRMLEIDSSSHRLLARAESVGHDLTRVSGSPLATPEEKERVARELQEVERLLRPLQDRAFRDPRVEASFRVLQDSVIATITRIDPAAEPLLERMQEIERQIQELDRAAAEPRAPATGWVPVDPPDRAPSRGLDPTTDPFSAGAADSVTRPATEEAAEPPAGDADG